MLMTNRRPLRYKISSWKQLPKCRSNNDTGLKITVSDIVNNDLLTGLRIQVVDSWCGVLFSEVVNARGALVSSSKTAGAESISYQLDDDTILKMLAKYGFLIIFEPRKHLSQTQLETLKSLKGLHFNKLRTINVWSVNSLGIKSYKWYVVGFRSCNHPAWLDNTYSPSKEEFTESLVNGTVVNISEIASLKDFDWSWLDYVANIDDILKDNEGTINDDECIVLGTNVSSSYPPEV